MTIFLTSILGKKYTNPSSDVITVLAGLDEVDRVISDFVAILDGIIRNGKTREIRLPHLKIQYANSILVGLRRKAIRAAVAMTSGAYKTSLVSYFTHRDLFPSLMKVCCLSTRATPSLTYLVCQRSGKPTTSV